VKILVTGGCGFIGSHFIEEVIKRDDVEKVDMESTLQGKIDVYNDSWENDYFYVGGKNNV
tara:strand:+ start:2334 stop:2513 length:180 start_codon:yes stop_codon:yes gene_type:complete